MKPIIRGPIIALLVGGLFLGSPASAQAQKERDGRGVSGKSFVYEATDCIESIVVIPVELGRLRPFVPERFELLDRGGGTSLLNIPIADCAGISVNGSTPRPGLFTDVGVQIAAPDGSDGAHFYLLWQVEDLPALRAKMRSVGITGGLDRQAAHTVDSTGLLTSANGAFHWPHAPFALEATTGPYAPDADGGNFWWHLGPQGLLRISYQFTNVSVAFGAGSVQTEAGTPLAAMLGAESADGLAVSVLLDVKGLVEVAADQTSAQDTGCVYLNPDLYCPVDETVLPLVPAVAQPTSERWGRSLVGSVGRSGCVYLNPDTWCPGGGDVGWVLRSTTTTP